MSNHAKRTRRLVAVIGTASMLAAFGPASAQRFSAAELEAMNQKLVTSVKRGYDLWYGARADMSNNGLACANCHPDAAATNPQTFPKFMPMFNKVVPYRDMVNWCVMNPQGGKALPADSEDMVALEAYSFYLHGGVKIEPGLQARQTAGPTPTTARGFPWKGTGIGFDK